MGDQSGNVEMAISWGDDLINVLDDTKRFDLLAQTLEHLRAIQFSCDEDFSEIEESLQDLQKKLDACKEKTYEASSGIADGEEIERLQRELDEELKLECKLKEELRYLRFYLVYVSTFMADELKDVNSQGELFEEQRLAITRKERDQLRTEKKLSMYASITKVIPNIDDPLKTSGYMVNLDQKIIDKFEFDAGKRTDYATCNTIWEIINKQ
ncbi:unnamed protein product [Microthlaspi erraticum]|uniref:Kinetochore protein Spc24 n=1 Tax=Microthlaspi erraticum TaxID=1685480 RepID=A0A6D2J2U9_9BRAS|nr:unnamed protein product [Microthlaspi erraticum]